MSDELDELIEQQCEDPAFKAAYGAAMSQHAKHAGHKEERNSRYDAYFCVPCDEWKEPKCSDSKCEFCVGRPEKPSEA